jgi:hypothetical protein
MVRQQFQIGGGERIDWKNAGGFGTLSDHKKN